MKEGSLDSMYERSNADIQHRLSIVTSFGNGEVDNIDELEQEGNSNSNNKNRDFIIKKIQKTPSNANIYQA